MDTYRLFIPIFALLLVTSCSQELAEDLPISDTEVVENAQISEITAEAAVSKALLDDSHRVSVWEDKDRISVLTSSKNATFELVSGAGSTSGTFSGLISVSSGSSLCAVYPVASSINGLKASFQINTNQTQSSSNDLSENDIYYSKTTVSGTSVSSLNLEFTPLTSLINLYADLSKYSTERIQNVRMETPGIPCSGLFIADLAASVPNLTGVSTKDFVSVDLPLAPTCAEPLNVNFSIAPCRLADGSSLRFIVTTDRNTYLFERKITGNIEAGKAYSVRLDSNNLSESSMIAVRPQPAQYVSRVTGDSESGDGLPNPTNTYTQYALSATDYGIMWESSNGSVLSVFGDNWTDKAFSRDWKSNTIGITTNRDLENGLRFDSFVMNGESRKEIIPHTPGDNTFSLIPSAAISAGGRDYILFSKHIMKPEPADPDEYLSEYSEIAWSDDNGQNWIRSGVQWNGSSNFVQGAYLKQNGFVYFYGIPSGRKGSVKLARVPESSILTKSAYTYWTGQGWSYNENDAVAITDGPAGELTVFYNAYYKRYIMMYLSVNRRAIVLRQALSPEGEWSGEQIVQEDAGEGLYGPSVHPWGKDGRDIYYVTSHAMIFDKSKTFWNVYLMKTTLESDSNGFNMVSEGGFEDYPDKALDYRSYWYFAPLSGDCKYVAERNMVNSGDVALKIENPKGNWIQTFQSVAVKPNTYYVMSCWARTSLANSRSLFLCARNSDNTKEISNTNPLLTNTEWRRVELEFNSGSNASVFVFINTQGWTTSDGEVLSIYIDDISIRPRL